MPVKRGSASKLTMSLRSLRIRLCVENRLSALPLVPYCTARRVPGGVPAHFRYGCCMRMPRVARGWMPGNKLDG